MTFLSARKISHPRIADSLSFYDQYPILLYTAAFLHLRLLFPLAITVNPGDHFVDTFS